MSVVSLSNLFSIFFNMKIYILCRSETFSLSFLLLLFTLLLHPEDGKNFLSIPLLLKVGFFFFFSFHLTPLIYLEFILVVGSGAKNLCDPA